MIQELLGGNNVGIIKGDMKSKLSNHPSCGGLNILDGSPSSSSSSSSAAAAAASAAENLRCPRCDSPNTKFCYYNNYNLTQPRHFCKTCRRYWTKGGALRNVPIGGGCRRNKTSTLSSAIGKSTGKLKTVSSEFIKTGLFGGFEHAHDHHHHHHHQSASANPNILWASSQNNYSHFLSLLSRANQNPNYPNSVNHLQNSVPVKEEGSNNFLFGSSISRVTGLDSHGPLHVPSSGLPSSLYGNLQQTPPIQLGSRHGGIHNNNNGFHQELYQRFRSPSSTSCYFSENAPSIHGNMASASNPSTASAILESAPAGTGELGFWNATLPWPTDLHLPTSTTNGAYP